MKKTIKKLGTSAGIIFNKEEMNILGFNIGDVIDLGDVVLISKPRVKK